MRRRAIQAGLLAASITFLASCSALRGRQAASGAVDDAAIAAEVKAEMVADREVAATSIDVDARDGVVRLTGFARSQAEKERAATIARRAKGARSVRNDIDVRP